jgi:hypothetical protein
MRCSAIVMSGFLLLLCWWWWWWVLLQVLTAARGILRYADVQPECLFIRCRKLSVRGQTALLTPNGHSTL